MIMHCKFLLTVLLCSFAFSAFAQTTPESQVDVAVTNRDVARGEILRESDLAYKPVPVIRANTSIARSIADVSGQETRRALRAGDMIRLSDVKRPTLVAKGATVTMLFEAPGMVLTSVGRAMTEGGLHDTITVQNPVSFRQVQANVVSPGTVRVGAGMIVGENIAASIHLAATP
jgi:flagella basal body P-ring formation protein FlgA